MATPTESLPPPGWDREGLDSLLDAFHEGRLSEIVGPRSSGGGSLLLALLARATSRGGLGARGARSARAALGALRRPPPAGVAGGRSPGTLPGLRRRRARCGRR